MSDEGRAKLREATLRGVRWISIARLVAELTALASTVALARMIPPAEFGRAAVALIVVALAAIIGPPGVTAPLIQRRSLEQQHIQAAAFLSLVIGGALTAATIAIAPVARSAFGDETTKLIVLASPAWLIAGVGAVSQAMLQRELRFRQIAIASSSSVLAGASAALGLAVAGVDAESLVVGGLVTIGVATAINVASSPPAKPWPTRRGVAEVGAFAAPVALSSLAFSAFRNVDYAILGARLSAAQVGFYWRAYQLGVVYQTKISQIMLQVSFPVYSRTETLEDLRRLRMKIVRVHAIVLVPLLGAFVAVAPVAIPWIFGSTWEPAVVPAQIMAVAGIGEALVTGAGPLLVAIGKPGVLVVSNVCELVLYAVMIFFLAPHGLIAVSIGVAAFTVGMVVVTQLLLLRPFVGLSNRQFVAEALPGFVVGACVLGVLTLLRLALEGVDLPAVAVLAACAVAGAAVYVAVLRALFDETWIDLASILRRVSGTKRSASLTESAPVQSG